MPSNRILAFGSSRVGTGGFMAEAVPVIKNFLDEKPLNIGFIPFASVGNGYDEYGSMIQACFVATPYKINTVYPQNAKATIEHADVIMVGGGNTFKLLHDIYKYQLLEVIRDRINADVPYIGWSAGSNITGPTIATTNDMPIIEPKSFNGLGLLAFQINPHYTNRKIDGHNGETRDQRLEEFVRLNPGVPVVALPEGTAVKLDYGVLRFIGQLPGVLFQSGENEEEINRREIQVDEDLSFLL
jgi:dipeptidase E